MKMKVSELKPGYRLLEAVQGKSSRPLVPRDTILTKEIIDVLNAFFITEVEAEPAVEKGKKAAGNHLLFKRKKHRAERRRNLSGKNRKISF